MAHPGHSPAHLQVESSMAARLAHHQKRAFARPTLQTMNTKMDNPVTNLAALYRRVSTSHQDNSLEVQETMNSEYCKRMAIPTLGQDYTDPDISGSIDRKSTRLNSSHA